MLRRAAFASLVVVTSVLGLGFGCGSGSSSRDPAGTGGSSSGSGGIRINFDGGGLTTGGGGNSGGATGTGNTAGATPTGSLVFQGNQAALLNNGPPCTSEEGATGDRWCAFFAGTDLYVVNVTQAAAGVSISCGLTDANCLKLTSTFFQDTLSPVVHFALFQGDTLAYFDATGTPFAWRPGMTAGRALATADPGTKDVVLCIPDVKGSAITCLRDLPAAMQTDPQLLLSDLLAGRVDGTATPPLARVETVIAASSADVNINHFQVGFPVAGGDVLAWSARGVKGGPEILKTQTLGNDASRATVATNVNQWRASPDGARWYWMSAVSESNGAGTLQTAPFPGGASPTTIATTTLGYELPTPTSLISVNMAKQLLAYPDPAGAPTTSQMLDTGVIGLVNLSKQGHVGYAKAVVTSGQTQWIDLYLKKPDGTGACTVSATTDAYLAGVFFTPSAGGLSWIARSTSAITARFTRLPDCVAMDVASSVVWTEPMGDRAVLFIDSFSSATGTGALKFRPLAAGAVSADPPTMVSGQVGAFYAISTPGLDAVVYAVNGGGNEDGIYVRSFGP